MSFHVTIVIVSYRSLADLRSCLAALGRSTFADFDVVICENGGQEAFAGLTTLPAVLPDGQPVRRFLAPGNLGYAGGVNFGIAQAPGSDAYWVLNPDTEPQPEALEALVARLRQGDCSAVGHDLLQSNGLLGSTGGHWESWTARAVSLGRGRPRAPLPDRRRVEAKVNYLNGASMLVSRAFIQRVGLMREDYFLYCEEVEWCLRALRAGERLGYAEDAVAVHVQGTTTGAGGAARTRSRTAVYLSERNRILLTRDLYPRRLPVVAALSLAHMVVRYAKARAWRQIGFGLSGWLAGLRDERGIPAWFEAGGTA